ncbi:Fluconazole resistance protein 1 [Madurella fahalii]|uniref:Fluconazole resistance protein 1 n=1 Tax=Madurella fahalii TaxID=1157608 RepID=A0ABQ0G213_9PEZI
MGSLPTPPNEELLRSQALKRQHTVPKPIKTGYRVAKRTATHGQPQTPTIDSHSQHTDGRHKRVWKACERCRMKKTKCDGEFPCKRCKDDGLVCTAGARKKTEYKQLPRGYAEVLENTQFALVATVQKLFSMVRSQQPWEYGEPELNDRGQPVIHDIAFKLGCLRPNSDMDLPVHSIFPEDEAGLAELARQLEEQQKEEGSQNNNSGNGNGNGNGGSTRQETEPNYNRTDRAGSSTASDPDYSELEQDYRKVAFGTATAVTMSPASVCYGDFDIAPPTHSPSIPSAFMWSSQDYSTQPYISEGAPYLDINMALLNRRRLEPSLDTIKPHALSCPHPEAMLGTHDPMTPMMYPGYYD